MSYLDSTFDVIELYNVTFEQDCIQLVKDKQPELASLIFKEDGTMYNWFEVLVGLSYVTSLDYLSKYLSSGYIFPDDPLYAEDKELPNALKLFFKDSGVCCPKCGGLMLENTWFSSDEEAGIECMELTEYYCCNCVYVTNSLNYMPLEFEDVPVLQELSEVDKELIKYYKFVYENISNDDSLTQSTNYEFKVYSKDDEEIGYIVIETNDVVPCYYRLELYSRIETLDSLNIITKVNDTQKEWLADKVIKAPKYVSNTGSIGEQSGKLGVFDSLDVQVGELIILKSGEVQLNVLHSGELPVLICLDCKRQITDEFLYHKLGNDNPQDGEEPTPDIDTHICNHCKSENTMWVSIKDKDNLESLLIKKAEQENYERQYIECTSCKSKIPASYWKVVNKEVIDGVFKFFEYSTEAQCPVCNAIDTYTTDFDTPSPPIDVKEPSQKMLFKPNSGMSACECGKLFCDCSLKCKVCGKVFCEHKK